MRPPGPLDSVNPTRSIIMTAFGPTVHTLRQPFTAASEGPTLVGLARLNSRPFDLTRDRFEFSLPTGAYPTPPGRPRPPILFGTIGVEAGHSLRRRSGRGCSFVVVHPCLRSGPQRGEDTRTRAAEHREAVDSQQGSIRQCADVLRCPPSGDARQSSIS
jgi:hypothetical protein